MFKKRKEKKGISETLFILKWIYSNSQCNSANKPTSGQFVNLTKAWQQHNKKNNKSHTENYEATNYRTLKSEQWTKYSISDQKRNFEGK